MAKKTKKTPRSRSMQLLVARVAKLEKTKVEVADATTSRLMSQLTALRHDVDNLLVSRRDNAVAIQASSAAVDKRLRSLEEVSGPTWKTADGTVLRMREMKDSHLQNAICFLERAHERQAGYGGVTYDNWRAKWAPKLEELRAEKARREKAAATEKKWSDLHNGTGPYAIDVETQLPPGRFTCRVDGVEQSFNGTCKFTLAEVRQAQGRSQRWGMPYADNGCVDNTLETCKAKAEDADGQLRYWKRCAESRLETVLRLRSTIKVLQHEIRGLKTQKTGVSGEAALLLSELRTLVAGFATLPRGTRGHRHYRTVKRLAELLTGS